MMARALVIGIGNPDRGDDAVGIAVARALAARAPPWVAVAEAGGDALALFDLWAEAERVVLVDATEPAGQPGRILRIDPARDPLPRAAGPTSSHGFGLAEAVALARVLGRLPPLLAILGIEAMRFDPGAALSAPVAAAVEAASAVILAELTEVSPDA